MNEKIPAETFASERGVPLSAVLSRIKSGIYTGVEENGEWFILRSENNERASTSAATPPPPPASEHVERVTRITNPTFERILSAVLIGLIGFNIFTLFFGAWLAVIPAAFQTVVLVAVRQRWPRARTIVRAWAVILLISGVAGVIGWLARFAMYAMGDPEAFADVVPLLVLIQIGGLVGGTAVWVLSGRYIVTEELVAVPSAS